MAFNYSVIAKQLTVQAAKVAVVVSRVLVESYNVVVAALVVSMAAEEVLVFIAPIMVVHVAKVHPEQYA
jgi:hypothetical protein